MIERDLEQLEVAPFRMLEFRERAEFEEYMRASETLRRDRWLYEQSLATPDDAVILKGSCGVCLTEATFKASTWGGESVAGGRVPNWREELVCDCKNRLNNRQRALLHYLLANKLLQPWTRVLGLGELGALFPMFEGLSYSVTCWTGALDRLPATNSGFHDAYHLLISMEQLNGETCRADLLAGLAAQLIDGGRIVFTTPFDVTRGADTGNEGSVPVGWAMLTSLRTHGFADAKACLYWSEEFGYLGPLNFIFEASK